MFTGYYIEDSRIVSAEGETDYYLDNNGYICDAGGQIGYFLKEGNLPDIPHIHGPDGYTRFYIRNTVILGPYQGLPWLDRKANGLL